jgi:N-acetyl-gamma-glutamyl-phosphate reductase
MEPGHPMTVAVLGASGYSGGELLRILTRREDIRLTAVTARTAAGQRLDAVHPFLTGRCDLTLAPMDGPLPDAECIFLALPSGESMHLVPRLLEGGARVVDLSGDFRLRDAALYESYYRRTHAAPHLLGTAVYGLPEIHRAAIQSACLVANPGCYPTSTILALLPALKHSVVKSEGIVITSLSGASGAGRSSSMDMSFAELHDNVRAYKVGVHQHIPEISTVLAETAGAPVSLSFVPHLIPVTRGIYTTVHASLAGATDSAEVLDLYRSYYNEAPFVRIRSGPPHMKDVLWTNFCDLGIAVDGRTGQLIVMSAIDNMMKGAAGQAVQNMNLMFGCPEDTALR